MVFQWRAGSRWHGDAQVVGNELETIRRQNDGRLLALDVVRAARGAKSALHGYFEWDDTEAAKQWRLEQARTLIRALVVVPDATSVHAASRQPVRAFVNIPVNGDTEPVYTSMVEALEHPILRERVLERALAELESVRRKYAHLEELSGVFEALTRVRAPASARARRG